MNMDLVIHEALGTLTIAAIAIAVLVLAEALKRRDRRGKVSKMRRVPVNQQERTPRAG